MTQTQGVCFVKRQDNYRGAWKQV